MRRPRPPAPGYDQDDDTVLLAALHALAAGYEPDLAAIGRRIWITGPAHASARTDRRRPRAVDRRTARHRLPVLLPVATVAVLIGGVVLAAVDGNRPAPGVTVPIAPAVATAVPSPAATSDPKATGPAPSSTRTPDRSPAPSSAANRARVSVQPLPTSIAGTALNLARPPLLDWVAVGARADGKQVRAKARVADPVVTVDRPAASTVVTGPFATSWAAGVPEQSRDQATGWLMADGPAGLAVTLAGSRAARTVVLYAGTRDLRGTLSIHRPGRAAERTPLGTASSTVQAFVITVELPAGAGPTRIRLGGSPRGPLPKVYLAAVTVSR